MSETSKQTSVESEPERIVTDDNALRAAENILAARYGGTPRLTVTDTLREKSRNRVLRCAVEEATADTPVSVIIKSVDGEGDHAYNPENDAPDGTAWRFYNEWAGNAFLDRLNLDPPVSAGLIGGNRVAGLIVLQDLGSEGKSLADWMLAEDRPALLAALRSYAASLGRLHAETIGKEGLFSQIRREIGGKEIIREKDGAKLLRESVPGFRDLCALVGETIPVQFDAEIEKIRRVVDEPGPFFAFTPGDTCPDNHRLTETPYARFFDFEFAGFSHALLTAAYIYLPFPTCWCVNRLPEEAVAMMESEYRKELSSQCPAASEDDVFYPQILSARAFWTITTLSWGKGAVEGEDDTWGISTIRQRNLLRLDTFANAAEKIGEFPALSDLSRRLAAKLRARWHLAEEMPLYPAFRERPNVQASGSAE
jgi:hypothetical protein